MAARPAGPILVARGGFGTSYRNYEGNEPDVITKLYGVIRGDIPEYRYSREEINKLITVKREFHINMAAEHPAYAFTAQMNTFIGVGPAVLVGKSAPSNGSRFPLYTHIPANSYAFWQDANGLYPAVKMPYLGQDFSAGHNNLTFPKILECFDLFVYFHTSFIHNDMKLNNFLYNPTTQKVSIIDLGNSKPFTLSVPGQINMPCFHGAGQYYFSYPPESIFFDVQLGQQISADLRLRYCNYFAGAPIVNDTERGWIASTSINKMLETVLEDYFLTSAPSTFTLSDKQSLLIGITTDLYGFGMQLVYSLRNVNARYNTEYKISNNNVTFFEIIRRIQLLLTHIHPKLRPFHFSILYYFKKFNNLFNNPESANLNINGNTYFKLSVFGNQVIYANPNSVMALGINNCPITTVDIQDNMLIFAFLIIKTRDEILAYFKSKTLGKFTKLMYRNVFIDAIAYFNISDNYTNGLEKLSFSREIIASRGREFIAAGFLPAGTPILAVPVPAAAPLPVPVPVPVPAVAPVAVPVPVPAAAPVAVPVAVAAPPPRAAPPPPVAVAAPPPPPPPPVVDAGPSDAQIKKEVQELIKQGKHRIAAYLTVIARYPKAKGGGNSEESNASKILLGSIPLGHAKFSGVNTLIMKDKERNHRTIHPKKQSEELLILLKNHIINDTHLLSILVKLFEQKIIYTSLRGNLQGFSKLLLNIVEEAYTTSTSHELQTLGPYLMSLIISNIINSKSKNSTIHGGRVTALGPLSILGPRTIKNRNSKFRASLHLNKTRKLNSKNYNLQTISKLNNTNNSKDTMYSSFQYDIITSQLLASNAPGKINVFYDYYLRNLENKEDIFIKLLNIKLDSDDTLVSIQKFLENKKYTELDKFLIKHAYSPSMSNAKKVLNTLNSVTISSYYFAFKDDVDRYEFLFNLYNNIPESEHDVENLANIFCKSKLGDNPFNIASHTRTSHTNSSLHLSTSDHFLPSPLATNVELS